MPIVRWEPFCDFVTLRDRMNRLFGESRAHFHGEESLVGDWLPAVDIYETEDAVMLQADVPGLDMNDLDIRVENNVLTLRGERKITKEVKEENYRRVERHYGSFARSFSLPNTVDPEKINATYNSGVLQVTMGKREETKPKQIKVRVNGTNEGLVEKEKK